MSIANYKDSRLSETIDDASRLPRELIQMVIDYASRQPHAWQDLYNPAVVLPAGRIGRQTTTELNGSSSCTCCCAETFGSQTQLMIADDEFDIECFAGADCSGENCVEIGLKSGECISWFSSLEVGQRGWFRVDLIQKRILARISPDGRFDQLRESTAVSFDSAVLCVTIFGRKKAIFRSGPAVDRPTTDDAAEVVVFDGHPSS